MKRILLVAVFLSNLWAVGAQHVVEATEIGANAEEFRQRDPSGGVMALIAISIVATALVLVSLVVKAFGAIMVRIEGRKVKVVVETPVPKKKPLVQQLDEQIAAIALAVKLYQEEQHINESTVITINRASRVYSPWSSKIHGITHLPK